MTCTCLFVECIDSCAEISCSDLTSLANGMITYSAGSRDDRLVGSAATHSCNNSYRLVGEAVRTCVSGGTWSGSAPVCQRKSNLMLNVEG